MLNLKNTLDFFASICTIEGELYTSRQQGKQCHPFFCPSVTPATILSHTDMLLVGPQLTQQLPLEISVAGHVQ